MYSSRYFRVRCIVRCIVEVQKVGCHVFLCRSLLLSTIVLKLIIITFIDITMNLKVLKH